MTLFKPINECFTYKDGNLITVSKKEALAQFSTPLNTPVNWVKVDDYFDPGKYIPHYVLPECNQIIVGNIYLATKIIKRGIHGKVLPILDLENARLVKCISTIEMDILEYWLEIKPAEMQKRFSLANVPPVIVKSIFEKI